MQTNEKCPVQVSVYNLICSQFTEIDANQSQKKGKRLKFDIQLACVTVVSFRFLGREIEQASEQAGERKSGWGEQKIGEKGAGDEREAGGGGEKGITPPLNPPPPPPLLLLIFRAHSQFRPLRVLFSVETPATQAI